jgi:hypothetical protein
MLSLQTFSASGLWVYLHVEKLGKIQNIHSAVHWLKIKSLGKIICEITFTEGMVRYRMGAVLGREHPNRDGGGTGNHDIPQCSNNARQYHLLPVEGARGWQGREGGR